MPIHSRSASAPKSPPQAIPQLRFGFFPREKVVDLTGQVVLDSMARCGYGGHAEIYKGSLVRDSGERMTVAIKILRVSPQGNSAPSREKLIREGKVWAGLNHPNITPFIGVCYDLGVHGAPCFVTPFYRNGDVNAFLSRQRSQDRLQLVCEVAAGVVYLHTLKIPIIHADIKPSNILINDKEHASIADFGTSRALETSGFTTTAKVSYRYTAVEIIRSMRANQDPSFTMASDVWAFAMTALEIFAARLPFYKIRHELAVSDGILRGHLPQHEDYPDVPVHIWSILQSCWAEDPTQRPRMQDLSVQFNILAAWQSGETLCDPLVISPPTRTHTNPSAILRTAGLVGLSRILGTHRRRRTASFSGFVRAPAKQQTAAAAAPYPCYWAGCGEQFDTLKQCQAHQLHHRWTDSSTTLVSVPAPPLGDA